MAVNKILRYFGDYIFIENCGDFFFENVPQFLYKYTISLVAKWDLGPTNAGI